MIMSAVPLLWQNAIWYIWSRTILFSNKTVKYFYCYHYGTPYHRGIITNPHLFRPPDPAVCSLLFIDVA